MGYGYLRLVSYFPMFRFDQVMYEALELME